MRKSNLLSLAVSLESDSELKLEFGLLIGGMYVRSSEGWRPQRCLRWTQCCPPGLVWPRKDRWEW